MRRVARVLCANHFFLLQVANADASTTRSRGETGLCYVHLQLSSTFWGKLLQFGERDEPLGCSLGLYWHLLLTDDQPCWTPNQGRSLVLFKVTVGE